MSKSRSPHAKNLQSTTAQLFRIPYFIFVIIVSVLFFDFYSYYHPSFGLAIGCYDAEVRKMMLERTLMVAMAVFLFAHIYSKDGIKKSSFWLFCIFWFLLIWSIMICSPLNMLVF